MVLKQLRRYVDDLICEHGEEYPCVSWTRLVEWTSISDNIMDNCTNLEELLAEMIQYWEADKAEQLLSQEVASGKYDNTTDMMSPKVGAKENTSFGIIRTFITNKAGVRRDIQLVSSPHYDEKYCCMVCTYLVQGVSEYTIVSEDTNKFTSPRITTGFHFADGPIYTVGGEFSNGVWIVGNILELKSFQPNAKGLVCCHLVVESK